MRPLILTMAFVTVAWSSQAEDVTRKIAELEPVTPAIKRLKPDFETGGFRVDMPASKIVERLTADGFTSTRRLWSKNGAGVDGRYFTTDKYDEEIAAFKESEEKSSKETLQLKFLPGQGGLSFISRRVEFQYRVSVSAIVGIRVFALVGILEYTHNATNKILGCNWKALDAIKQKSPENRAFLG